MSDNISLKDFIAFQLDTLRNEIKSQNLHLIEKIDNNEKSNQTRRHELMNQMTLVRGKLDDLETTVSVHNERLKQQENFKKIISGIAIMMIIGVIATLLAPLGISL